MSEKIGITFEELDFDSMSCSQGNVNKAGYFTNATGLTLCTTVTLTNTITITQP